MGSSASATLIMGLTLVTSFFMCGLYSVMFSIIGECNVPAKVAGTAISIVSVVAYIPDMFIHTMYGKFIDTYGKQGYSYIFIIMLVMCVLGFLGISYLVARKKNMEKNTSAVKEHAAA